MPTLNRKTSSKVEYSEEKKYEIYQIGDTYSLNDII